MRQSITLDLAPEAALDLIARVVAEWGGEWRSEEGEHALWLPVSAGLRRGVVAARVDAVATGGGARIDIGETHRELYLNRGAAGVMLFGAFGGVVAMLWPFFPELLRIAPVGAVLAVVAWLMVAGRLRSSDLGEFVEAVEVTAANEGDRAPAPA